MTSESSDTDFGAIEDRLSQAMESQASRFEPSDDSFERLASAVDTLTRSDQQSARRLTVGRPLAIAAASLAVLGLGVIAVAQRPPSEVATALGSGQGANPTDQGAGSGEGRGSESTDSGNDELGGSDDAVNEPSDESTQAKSTTEGSEDTNDLAGEDDPTADQAPDPDEIAREDQLSSPLGDTRAEAVQRYLDMIGMTNSQFDAEAYGAVDAENPGAVDVPITSGGVKIAELRVVQEPNGFMVSGTSANPDLSIDEIDYSKLADGFVTVAGTGYGFEGSVAVDFIAVGDSRKLASVPATAGSFGEVQSFSVDVPVSGNERVIVVLQSLTPTEFDPVFVARQLAYKGPADESKYSVVNVLPDDSDGGLIIRDGPGTTYEPIGVLEPGYDSITRSDEFEPYVVDSQSWWHVVGPDEVSGWVNSAFVASAQTPSAAQQSAADEVFFQLSVEGYDNISFASRVAVGSVIDPEHISGRGLTNGEAWSNQRRFDQGIDGSTFEGSLAEFYALASNQDANLIPSMGVNPELETYFGGLQARQVTVDLSDGQRQHVYLYFAPTPAGIQVVGILAELVE